MPYEMTHSLLEWEPWLVGGLEVGPQLGVQARKSGRGIPIIPLSVVEREPEIALPGRVVSGVLAEAVRRAGMGAEHEVGLGLGLGLLDL